MENTLPKGSAQYINRLNKIKVLNLIRESGKISRADIVKVTGLSAPTITRIVDSLINVEKLVAQTGIGESGGGRPPVIVHFNGESKYVIGIDWGRTHIHGILTNLNGESFADIDIPTSVTTDYTESMERVFGLIEGLIKESKIAQSDLAGIGVAAAGFVSRHNQHIEFSPNFGWRDVDLCKPLLERFNVPVIVDNVSRVMAMGEMHYGGAEKLKNFLFINVGYGIGSGIILDHKPFYGNDGWSGEIGHTRVGKSKRNVRQCSCGKKDCLECFSSGRGIVETVERELSKYPNSVLNEVAQNDERLTGELIAVAAQKGDELALKAFNLAADYLGTSVASVANILNPEAIFFGGKVMKAGDFFLSKIEQVFQEECLLNKSRSIRILKTELGDMAAVKGATSLILNEILNFNV
jgi:glucokinase-like ROK family protein